MADEITDTALDERLRSADPLTTGSLPSEADTEAALLRLLAAVSEAGPARGAPRLRVRLGLARQLVGTTLGLAGVGAALALVLGGASTSAAFAVTRNHDGTVTISIERSSGIAGANAKLHRLGIRAIVMPQAPVGCRTFTLSKGQPAPPPSRRLSNAHCTFTMTKGDPATAHWTINPSEVPAGRTLALTPPTRGNSGHGGNSGSGGRVWSCTPTVHIPAPLGNSGTVSVPAPSGGNPGSSGPPPANGSKSGHSGNTGHSGNSGSGGQVWSCGTEGAASGPVDQHSGPPPSPNSGGG